MHAKTATILLVDDEPDILEILEYNLLKDGYQISTAGNGEEAIKKARKIRPDLIILDLMMPVMDGIETCKQLRQIPELNDTIIIFLSARGEDHSQMEGYHAGADDYITKPVKPKVLMSKVKALLRRFRPDSSVHIIKVDDLYIDRAGYKVVQNGCEIHLPRKEFELLALLASSPNKVFSREDILRAVWGGDVVVGDRTIDVHIRKLRGKIGSHKLKTVKGVGYKFIA